MQQRMKQQVVLPFALRKQLEQDKSKTTGLKDSSLWALRQRKRKRKERKLVKRRPQQKVSRTPTKVFSSSSGKKKTHRPTPKVETQNSANPSPLKNGVPLQRKIRALLNRVSEGNAESIARSLEALLESLSDETEREHFHSSLVRLLLESLNNHSSLVSSVHPYASSFAAIVAFFHFRDYYSISTRLVYPLVQQIISSYQSNAQDVKALQDSDSNVDIFSLLVLVMELYKLQVIHCQVIYELIRYFASNLSELTAQCLLVMIRRCGVELRKDDPQALKHIIEYIRENAEAQRKSAHMSKVFSTRLEMILELIYDWKDNKLVNKDSNPSFPWIASLIASSSFRTDRRLQFSLKELQDGRILYNDKSKEEKDLLKADCPKLSIKKEEEISQIKQEEKDSVDQFVRLQRLNTDTRRNIFRMIMTSEDVVDAEHRLVAYGGKRKSLLLEIANMVIFGCCHERQFNTFYVALTKRLCVYSSRYKKAFQFSLWQIWKRMEQGEKWSSTPLKNLSSYIGELIFERTMSISCFRVLPNLSHFTPSLRTLLYLILEKAKNRCHDDLLVLLKENISDTRCQTFYYTLYFLLQDWKQENHSRVNEWLHFLQTCNLFQLE
ncbi:uncharacterized protein Gasu_55040 [Galdieria sulphuraria]|uniref:MI domain-containing protein n=1 Tax=Galdieria sulphuraria TaxID=130081 RepID=M2XU44_GALSU|nr:uncharacterized protein Gasu_55040 [Galdieria sulphuraria]EME26934.1 hypothetical protein Gasu_55040 [Galdieria sulphuraria]|eukprot:XP_005703454.1 hypothetical protein Gasu_55040 [Galdieria sulphuraria]